MTASTRSSTRPGGRVAALVALVATLALLAGCTATIDGTASPVESASGEAPLPSADPTPAPESGPGVRAEAHRIAGVTAAPRVVFPEMDNSCFPTLPIVRPDALEAVLFAPGTATSIYTEYGFVAGWASCANQLDGPLAAISFVAEMSDPDSAMVAAAELAESFQLVNGGEPAEIPSFEDLPAVESTEVEGGEDVITLEVLQPVGRMLAYTYFTAAEPDLARDQVGELLEEQRELLNDFEPTPQDEIADLSNDSLDLERRTAAAPGDSTVFSGTFGLQGFLHLSINPMLSADLLPPNGFEGLFYRDHVEDTPSGDSNGYQMVTYQFGSAAESDAVFAEFTRIEQEAYVDRVSFTLPEDSTIPCFYIPPDEPGGSLTQRCYSRVGPYLGATTVDAVIDPADITAMRTFVADQIARMSAP